jgi:hypothetical protein
MEKGVERIKNDLICDQYTNACKLSAKLRQTRIFLSTIQIHQINFNFLIVIFFHFYVIKICSKFGF